MRRSKSSSIWTSPSALQRRDPEGHEPPGYQAELLDLLTKLRARIPGLVLRTSSSPACPARARRNWKSCVSFSGDKD
ncbi:MAG: hypothetical protein ACLTYN_06785 [Dysosmobacter welbionis]